MPRSSSVSEKVWAQAIHAVNVQKMSLRRAAQLYGVHHMSLHRRVRGRYAANSTGHPVFQLSPVEEAEAITVLREQHVHEGRVTSDDVRYVVRAIASQNGRRDIPHDFPSTKWISDFKNVNGFMQPPALANGVEAKSQSFREEQKEDFAEDDRRRQKYMELFRTFSPPGRSNHNADFERSQYGDTSESESEHHHGSSTDRSSESSSQKESKKCKQSNSVSPETWEKAMDAVEIHGMSLRNAAKAYGVHFAALHRRVKKRALKKESTPPLENYIPFEDEAGIVRVIHARADLGILMTFDELVELLHRTALKYSPVISPDVSQIMVQKFQSRVEQSVRHLVKDWPLPRFESLCRMHQPVSVVSPAEEKGKSAMPTIQLPTIYSRHQEAMVVDPRSSHFPPLCHPPPASIPLYQAREVFPNEDSKRYLSPSRQEEKREDRSPPGTTLRL